MNPNERLVSELKRKQKGLGLTDEDTGLQESPSLTQLNAPKPEDLEFYEQVFVEMVQQRFPLQESDRRDLEYFQRAFRLSDEDVLEIEQRVMQEEGLLEADEMPSEPRQVSFRNPSPPMGATMPPQDTYSGEGSTTPTIPNRPPSANRAAMQSRVKQRSEMDVGNIGGQAQAPEMSGQGMATAGMAPIAVDPPAEPQRSSTPAPSAEPAPAAAPEATVVQAPASNPAPVPTTQVNIKPAEAEPPASESTPPPAKRFPSLNRNVLLAFGGITLFLLTAGLVSWFTLRSFTNATTPDPDGSKQFMTAGTQKSQQGQFQAAIADFDRAIQLNSTDANAYINRGYARHRSGNLGGAVDDYRKAIELNPNSALAYSNLSHVRFDQGRFSDAEKDANQAIGLKKDLPEAYVNLGNALFAQGKPDQASQQFQTALNLPASNSTKARAHNNRGNIFLERGEVQQAGQEYDQAIQLDPQYADAFFNRAIAHERNQNFLAAAQDFAESANLYKAQGNDRRSQESQTRADRARQASGTTPPPPATPNSNQRAI
ncbi:MAG: tetratricopeptide repeat protein [Leptolyngbyaceae cyanobacterium bins.302]|nr:tetratricopeptide repeat protein [Leptolyngbyaceae cyanobacterium bins.302]